VTLQLLVEQLLVLAVNVAVAVGGPVPVHDNSHYSFCNNPPNLLPDVGSSNKEFYSNNGNGYSFGVAETFPHAPI
jgi:hypothetical protein